MQDQALRKNLADGELQRRTYRLLWPFFLGIVPLLILAGSTWFEYGVLSWAGVAVASLMYAMNTIYFSRVLSRATIEALQREGCAPEDYRPPWLF